MSFYAVKFFDHGHNIYATKHIECVDDEQAAAAAQRLNVASIGAGFEVWQNDRFILQVWNGGSGPILTVRPSRPPGPERPATPENGGHA